MRRIGFTLVFALSLLMPLSVEAQQTGKVYRIGYLSYLGCSVDPFLKGHSGRV